MEFVGARERYRFALHQDSSRRGYRDLSDPGERRVDAWRSQKGRARDAEGTR